jgi:hypothetical protein
MSRYHNTGQNRSVRIIILYCGKYNYSTSNSGNLITKEYSTFTFSVLYLNM